MTDANRRSKSTRKETYLDLLNKVEEIEQREDTGLQTAKDLGEVFKEVNLLSDESNGKVNVDETFLDVQVLSKSSGMLVKCIDSLSISSSDYNPLEFAANILKAITTEGEERCEEDLLKLVDDVTPIIGEVPEYYSLYGAFDIQNLPVPKEKTIRSQIVKQNTVKKVPEKLVNARNEEKDTKDTVNFLYDVLVEEYKKNKKQPISYYKFIIDSDCFTTTVENMFHTSFLVHDGKAMVYTNDGDISKIKPLSAEESKKYGENKNNNSQMIVDITMEKWRQLKHMGPGFLQKRKAK